MKREKGREELKIRDSRFLKKRNKEKKGQIWGAVAAGTRQVLGFLVHFKDDRRKIKLMLWGVVTLVKGCIGVQI